VLLVLDNYDSFTWNLVQHLGELGGSPTVVRNDELTVEELVAMNPERAVISPGPCTPREAGVSVDLIRALAPRQVPILGVCLGHQAVGEAFGGRTIRAGAVMHGKTGRIRHSGEGIFQGLADPLEVARYHSLVTDPATLPEELLPVAWSRTEAGGREAEDGGEIQAVRHRELPVWGVQFHPESLFSQQGRELLGNFLSLAPAR
jgi:anthranilate synthase component II